MSDDEEYEEKEYLVYLDFESYVGPEELESPNLDFKIIGVDSNHPIVQVNGKLFRGSYDFTIGTNVFFEEEPNPPAVDPLYDITPNQFYKVFAKTQKVLKMERIFVEKWRNRGETSDCDIIAELKIRKQPNMSYSESLNLLLKPGTVPPRVIPNENIPLTPFVAEDLPDRRADDYIPDRGATVSDVPMEEVEDKQVS